PTTACLAFDDVFVNFGFIVDANPTQAIDGLHALITACRGIYRMPQSHRQLNRCCSNSACTTMNQQGFTLAQLTTVEHIAPDSEEGFWQARRFQQAETRRNRQALLYWHHTIFGIAPPSDQRTDLITNLELTALHIARYDFTSQFQTGNIRGTSRWRVSACSLQD